MKNIKILKSINANSSKDYYQLFLLVIIKPKKEKSYLPVHIVRQPDLMWALCGPAFSASFSIFFCFSASALCLS